MDKWLEDGVVKDWYSMCAMEVFCVRVALLDPTYAHTRWFDYLGYY